MRGFELNKFALVKNILSKEDCDKYTRCLKELVANNQTIKDHQCPVSEAIYGAPIFDELLERLLPVFEEISGVNLLPTYSYARFYAPGEELKIHTDDPPCEISASLTLGFEGDVWPIYMADHDETKTSSNKIGANNKEFWPTNVSKVNMEVGEAVIYYGREKLHWREKYTEGKWQAQVFFHYVNANGPYAEWKYDKRKRLSHQPAETLYWHFPDAFPIEAAERVIKSAEKLDTEDAKIGSSNDEGVVNKEVRDVKKIALPAWTGLGAQMAGMALDANRRAWKFNVSHANQCDYLIYDVDGHYHAHIDTFINSAEVECRKLTVLAFLNEDFKGGRLFLQVGSKKVYPPQQAGTVLIFPSFVLHGVEPVTEGIRRSIVTWMVGPWFK